MGEKKVNVDLPVRWNYYGTRKRWSGKEDEDGIPLLMHPHPYRLVPRIYINLYKTKPTSAI
jgi:hypothetical protein